MNPIDITIIYFTCGAPFSVYFFIQNKDQLNKFPLFLRTTLIILFWFLYAIKLLHSFVTKMFLKFKFGEISKTDSKIETFEKIFSQILREESVEISLFDFRETFERYVGLTKELKIKHFQKELELYEIANHENKKLATQILNRRNRFRLKNHQTIARTDFLGIIKQIDSKVFEKEKVRNLTIEFVKLINDFEAHSELLKIFSNTTQSEQGFPVKEVEKEVWNPIEPKQLPTHQTVLNFHTLSTTATTSKRD